MKSIFISKTFLLACAQALSGVAVVFATAYPMLGWLLIVKAIIDVVLRYYTDEPVNLTGR